MEYKLSSFEFSPDIDREDKHFAIVQINSVRSKCPSDSNFSGSFEKSDDFIIGEIKILFSKGQFTAQIKSTNMQELMRCLVDNIQDQITLWKEVRFEQDETFIDYNLKMDKKKTAGS